MCLFSALAVISIRDKEPEKIRKFRGGKKGDASGNERHNIINSYCFASPQILEG